MKKIILSVLLAMTLLFTSVACTRGGGASGDTLTVIWDSAAFLYNFDEIGAAIDTAEAQLEQDIGNPTEAEKNLTRKQIDNTKLMQAWAQEQGKTIKCVDWGWADTLTQKLSAAFFANEGPDIVCGESQMPYFMDQGVLEPFPDDLSAYIKQNISPLAYETMMDADGKIYGICLSPSNTILAWNKEILRSAGVDSDVIENGPSSWAEWESAMQKVADMNNPLKLPGGVYYGANNGGYLRVGALMNGVGGSYADEAGEPKINTSANEEAFEFVRKTAELNNYNTSLKGTDSGYFSAFTGGNIAYIMDGVWAVQQNSGLSFEVGFSRVPGKEEGTTSNQLLGAAYMCVPTYSANKELAFDCLERMLQTDIQQNIADGGLRTPVLKSVYESDDYKTEHALLYSFVAGIEEEDVPGLPPFVKALDLSGVWTAVGSCLSELTKSGNSQTVAQLLEKAQEGMMAAYEI